MTTITIKNEIVIESSLDILAMLVKQGSTTPIHESNGDIKYEIKSKNSEEIKNFWDKLNKSKKISCIESSNKNKHENKDLEDIIKEMKEESP
ncbi:hypothetical protein K8R14_02195 [bacterium]|nr:hypothetical protein [bacterium]